MNCDETGLAAILEYNKAPLASAQQIFFGERSKIDRSLDRRTIYGHDVTNANSGQRGRRLDLRIARSRRLREKPANKRKPQSPESAGKEPKQAEHDEHGGDELANSRGNSRRTNHATRPSPGDRTQHTAAIERISRNHVEDAQRDIDIAQPNKAGPNRRRRLPEFRTPPSCTSQTQEHESDDNACDRSDNRHPEFRLGVGRFLFDICDTAEGKQRYGSNRHAAAFGNNSMREFVNHDARKEEQCRND